LKSNILAITLARGGSKAIKNKNIKKINGKPLVFYTISEAKKSKYISDYIVSTDSTKIAKISKAYGAIIPFLRPKKLSTDKASSVDALIHATRYMEKINNKKYDYVIELMCTNPLKKVKDIDSIIKKIKKYKCDSVIAVNRVLDNHPARIKKIIKGKIINFCINEKAESRRQDLKPYAYVRSGSIYALNRDYLINKRKRYGSKKSFAYILPPERSINIDQEIDFYIAEKLLKK
jgi:CMP-N-acetylneuraminic acid synthetase|tara:strand:- start:282 stop:980 length:699 start_codon:yes stop_codon:yes gene_type:complete